MDVLSFSALRSNLASTLVDILRALKGEDSYGAQTNCA